MADEAAGAAARGEPAAEPAGTEAGERTAGAGEPAGAGAVDAVDVRPPTRLERAAYGVVRGAGHGVAKLWVRLEIHGAEHLPPTGAFVLAPVHRSNLDFLLVSFPTRRRMRYMGKASLWKIGPVGRFFTMLGAFPVHRGTADRGALRTCMDLVARGEPVVMFPEGTRRSGTVVEDVFDGPAYVAARAGVPLVPVGIGGSDAAMPIGARFIRPRKIVLTIGEPIHPPEGGTGGSRVPRRVMREMTERLRRAVQDLYDEARRRAG